MVFSSITFVYAFFPLVAVAYYLSKNRVYRNVVLLLASLLFYSWGEPRFLLLMLAATLAAYCGGLLMERSTAHKRLILIVTVVLLVGGPRTGSSTVRRARSRSAPRRPEYSGSSGIF